MSPPPTWAVVPSEGRRCLHDCLASIRDQVDGIVLVANGGYTAHGVPDITVVEDPSPDRNISRWWNLGLDRLAELGLHEWNALVLNDDTVLEPGAVRRLAEALRRHSAALAYPGLTERLLTEPGPDRITGWCFMLRGEVGLRADESMAWWYSDNDLQFRAAQSGGVVTVPGVGIFHTDPNGYTNRVPALAEQAGRDRATFLARWGRLPH